MARILFFGKLGDIAGTRARDVAIGANVKTVSDLRDVLSAENAGLGAALTEKSVRCIVNEAMAPMDAAISDSDEVAFIPPVSGG